MLLEAAGRSNVPCKGKCETLALPQQNRKLSNQHKRCPLCAPIVLCRKVYQSNTSSLFRSSRMYAGVLVPAGIWGGVAKASASPSWWGWIFDSEARLGQWHMGAFTLTFARWRDSAIGSSKGNCAWILQFVYFLVNTVSLMQGDQIFPSL